MITAEDLLAQHIKALRTGDVNALISHYAEDAMLIYTFGIAKGPAELRQVFSAFLADIIPPATTTLTIESRSTQGNIAYIIWNAESDSHHIPFATDTFIIKNGKIMVQTSAGRIVEK